MPSTKQVLSDLTIFNTYRQNGCDWAKTSRALTAAGTPLSRDAARRRVERAGLLRKAEDAAKANSKLVVTNDNDSLKSQFTILNPAPPAIDPQLLLDSRIAAFRQKRNHDDAVRNIRVKVNIDGPIGLGWFGDPHVDDDGTDLELLFEHADIFDGRNEGLYGACIGDVRNNWVGRLARLWAEQGTSAEEAKVLTEEFLRRVAWFLFIRGNHDAWSGSDDILDFLLADNATVDRPNRAQVTLVFPNGREVKIYAAHDFKGRSMWTPVFGAAKKAQLHQQAHIYICGHLHASGYQHGFHADGKMWHAVRMASYKKLDRYVEELGIEPDMGYECPVSIINPYARNESELVTWDWTPEAGADRLAWMRSKHQSS